jgi:hypothetical protein
MSNTPTPPPFLDQVIDALGFRPKPSVVPKRLSLPVDEDELPVLLDALLAYQTQMGEAIAGSTTPGDDGLTVAQTNHAHLTLLGVRVRRLMDVHDVK